jgi:hypothetical protein
VEPVPIPSPNAEKSRQLAAALFPYQKMFGQLYPRAADAYSQIQVFSLLSPYFVIPIFLSHADTVFCEFFALLP